MAKLFTVRLKNEPGALARLAAMLGEHGIDIRTIAAGAVGSTGCAVLSTSNDSVAREVMRKARYTFEEGEVLNVGLEDRPGGRHQGKAELGITVDNVETARRIVTS